MNALKQRLKDFIHDACEREISAIRKELLADQQFEINENDGYSWDSNSADLKKMLEFAETWIASLRLLLPHTKERESSEAGRIHFSKWNRFLRTKKIR